MRNTKIELGENVRKHLNDFMLKMKNAGYGPKYRAQILNSALNAFNKMVEEDKIGKKPLHRSRTWNQESRILAKQSKMKNWYKSVDKSGKVYKSILFVPPTPGSGLLKELKNREEELNKHKKERIKIVEKGGMKIETLLTNKNPFKNKKCEAKGCPLCKGEYGDFKIPCNTNNTGYRWICKTCEKTKKVTRVYEGETSRSIRIRSTEHISSYANKKSNSVLFKHKTLEHIDESVEFGLEITGVFKDALTRQANEAIRIYNRNGSEILNSKSEFCHPPTARVMVEAKKNPIIKPNRLKLVMHSNPT